MSFFFNVLGKSSKKVQSNFKACCKELSEAMSFPPNSFFRVEDNAFLYLAVGYVDTEEGPGFFDQKVNFCPFCSTKIV